MKNTKVQWHPGFIAAIDLEFARNRGDLVFDKEYNLNTKPLEIDLLVIKKEPSVRIENEIGWIFKGHNIMEYKCPGDHLDIDVFYKSIAYASLYKSYGRTLDERKADDITISILRQTKPAGLFQYFMQHGYTVSNPHHGIYYVDGNIPFQTQIIATEELDEEPHQWLGGLSDKLKKQKLQKLVETTRQLTDKYDRELADSVLDVSIGANQRVFEELKEDKNMSEALLQMMMPDLELKEKAWKEEAMRQGLEQGIERGIEQGIERGIRGTVDILRNLGQKDPDIKNIITKQYNLSNEEADSFL